MKPLLTRIGAFLASPKHLHIREVLLVFATVSTVIVIFASTPFYTWVDDNILAKWQFLAREKLGRSPKLDPRIKIFSYDDKTAARMQKHDFRLKDWAWIFSTVSKRAPASVFVDKIWALPIGRDFDHPVGKSEGERFQEWMGKVKAPINVGSSVYGAQIYGRKELSFQRPEHKIATFLEPGVTAEMIAWMPDYRSFYAYGPHDSVAPAFNGVGHIDYVSHGFVEPVKRLSEDALLVHASLLTANLPITFHEDGMRIGGKPVPLDRDGRVYANLSSLQDFRKHEESFYNLIYNELKGKKQRHINAGDYVAILPLMYTGNVDYIDTPIGHIQGGYLTVAMINSAITGQWLAFESRGRLFMLILLATLIGVFCGSYLGTGMFWTALTGGALFFVAQGIYDFSFNSLVTNWAAPTLALTMAGLTSFVWGNQRSAFSAKRLREALEGSIPGEKIEQIVQARDRFRIEPCEKEVTVMFIDIVGFSISAEDQTPERVFANLKAQLAQFTDIVHQHGGIIDKNLGDGILCFFGYDYVDGGEKADHADEALYCAIELQEASLTQTLNAEENDDPVHPIRIGINTANAFIGDLGDAKKIDFTLIGHGVNFASRLEGACEPFMIMLGPATKNKLRTLPEDYPGLHQRYVQIKHHDSLFEAFEYNPFYDDNRRLMEALAAYRRQFNISRKDARFNIADRGSLVIDLKEGSGNVVNVSLTGFAVEFDFYLAKGVTKTMDMHATAQKVNDRLKSQGLLPLSVEICWGGFNNHSGKYLHGLKIKGLNESQQRMLLDCYLELLDTDEKDYSRAS